METHGTRQKRNLAPAAGALINRRFLFGAAHPVRTSHRADMETPAAAGGFTDSHVTHQANFWRPWTGRERRTGAHHAHAAHGDLSDAKTPKPPQVIHPVKLYWPKSRCFDYLYREAEMLLRNYPVQATICPYDDSSSDEDSVDEEEEAEKQLN